VSEPRHHYYPAALIAQFRLSGTRKVGRNAPVCVARRGVDKPLVLAADDCGWDPKNRRLYQSQDGSESLDELWQRSERMVGEVIHGVNLLRDGEPAPAGWFVNVLAPFVAQLLARPPRLVLDDMSDLTTESSTRESALGQRQEAFAHFLDAIVYQRRWLVVDAPPGSLPSTDLGWIYMPGEFPGELFIPVTPSRAVVVRGGRPWTYFHGDDLVDIPVVAWPVDQVRVRAEAMMLVAPREVYAATPDLTEHALRLWGAGGPAGTSDSDLAAGLAQWESWVTGGLLRTGSAKDPTIAWQRFLVASHRFAECHCEDAMRREGLNRQQRREAMTLMRSNLSVLARTLPQRRDAEREPPRPEPAPGL
jgi:hypothetical protein